MQKGRTRCKNAETFWNMPLGKQQTAKNPSPYQLWIPATATMSNPLSCHFGETEHYHFTQRWPHVEIENMEYKLKDRSSPIPQVKKAPIPNWDLFRETPPSLGKLLSGEGWKKAGKGLKKAEKGWKKDENIEEQELPFAESRPVAH